MTEQQLEKWAKKEAAKRGVLAYKFRSPSKRGVPDQLFLYAGCVMFIEFKNPKGTGKLSPLQVKEIQLLRDNGASVYVVQTKERFINLMVLLKARSAGI